MDRQTRYLIQNYSHLMTLHERAAYRVIGLSEKAANTSSAGIKSRLEQALEASNSETRALLEGGPDAFFARLQDRLLRDCGTEVIFNCCPQCGALARTPTARQCPDCHYSRHED